jgi:hypothetical protein
MLPYTKSRNSGYGFSLYYVVKTNKKAVLTTASIQHPRINNTSSLLNKKRFRVIPRTPVAFLGEKLIDVNNIKEFISNKSFTCNLQQLRKTTSYFAFREDAINWFFSNYKIVNGQVV